MGNVQEATAKRILDRLREQEGEMAELLQRLALAESPSLAPRAQARALAILSEELESLDFAVKRIPGRDVGDHLEAEPARASEGRSRQLLLGHLDTVWPLGTVEQMPVKLEQGRLSGPGVYDMKGGLVQMLFALRALAELGLAPSVRAVVFVNSDEEIGSPGSAEHISRLARAAVRAYVLEPSFGAAGRLKTARKGVARFRLRIKGEASHAGLSPEKGVSAILEASHQIQRLFDLNDPERGVTVNVGTIDGGLRPNVIAPEVVADVDARALREEDARKVEQAILALAPVQEGIRIEVEGGFGRPPLEPTERNRALWEAARRAAAELGIPLEQATVGGASDGNITSNYTATLDGLGPVGEGAHAAHEYVSVSQMPERAALLALLVMMPA
ncbi:MAG: M20 family metallopeptidase [Gaiellaceae bacterium]